MGVDPKAIEVGNCYVTNMKQVRRVTDITDDGKVHYDARGRKSSDPWGPGSTKANPPSIEKFADDVDRKVRCDYDADTGGPN
ncbi:MAG: hypothetical protein AB7E81_06745 [Hyphomicrobiaceae bacterium]